MNKYNSLTFRVWLDFSDPSNPGTDRIQRRLRLKHDRIKEDVLAYLRASIMQKYTAEQKEHLLVSTPVDIQFEMLMCGCAI